MAGPDRPPMASEDFRAMMPDRQPDGCQTDRLGPADVAGPPRIPLPVCAESCVPYGITS